MVFMRMSQYQGEQIFFALGDEVDIGPRRVGEQVLAAIRDEYAQDGRGLRHAETRRAAARWITRWISS